MKPVDKTEEGEIQETLYKETLKGFLPHLAGQNHFERQTIYKGGCGSLCLGLFLMKLGGH